MDKRQSETGSSSQQEQEPTAEPNLISASLEMSLIHIWASVIKSCFLCSHVDNTKLCRHVGSAERRSSVNSHIRHDSLPFSCLWSLGLLYSLVIRFRDAQNAQSKENHLRRRKRCSLCRKMSLSFSSMIESKSEDQNERNTRATLCQLWCVVCRLMLYFLKTCFCTFTSKPQKQSSNLTKLTCLWWKCHRLSVLFTISPSIRSILAITFAVAPPSVHKCSVRARPLSEVWGLDATRISLN